jgi:asparagine synthase (glutamine-hydrolysing)
VLIHLVSDVPVGVFLSGGLDSSALVALMSRVADEKPHTFTIDFGEKGFSEISYARLVANQFGTDHHEILLTEDRLLQLLPDAFRAMDQPTMDGINTFVIAKAVRDTGIKVAVSGVGADELFGGYPSFLRAKRLRMVRKFPVLLRSLVSSAGRTVFSDSVGREKFWDLLACDGSARAAYRVSRQLFGQAEIRNLLGKNSLRSLAIEGVDPSRDVINAITLCEIRGYMANTLLRDTDFMAMAHGMEIRVPFVDPVVVRAVLDVPASWRMDFRRPKSLLADVMSGLLRQSILKRPKMGFALPFERWMRSILMPEVDSILSDRQLMSDVGINPEFSTKVWQTFKNSPAKERWARPWALYALGKWCKLNGVTL